ncbi:hypothetical protein BDN70DRAFT_937040 [Pholiota conissans]|uniref:Uncharacterized protein n=1 Tax=Pholiota conissans TaxID=109636 RepID=A0A9P5YRV5_9AGAR|nr:hypothetical protein BDN70DRAFT_937040 [Pholiota conissans]
MYSRAGLVSFIFALLIALAANAAPIPNNDIYLTSPAGSETFISHLAILPTHPHQSPPTAFDVDQIRGGNNIFIPTTVVDADSAIHRRGVDDLERRNIFDKIRNAFRKVGNAIKHVVKKAGKSIKRVAQKVFSGVKKIARKTKQFIKDNGAKIAKIGLKGIAAATKVGSKFVGYIPGVGKVLSKGMARASKAADFAANRIHANMDGKLGQAMDGMDKAEHYIGYIPREVFEEESLLERAFEEFYDDFDARDPYE